VQYKEKCRTAQLAGISKHILWRLYLPKNAMNTVFDLTAKGGEVFMG
jgi:hypothetical protein